MALRRSDPPVVVPDLQRRRLARRRGTVRRLDEEGVISYLRRCWSATKVPAPPNPVSGERPERGL